MHYPRGTYWGGYGHMGCCSLLAIQEVKSVNPVDRDDLDYGASVDQPDVGKLRLAAAAWKKSQWLAPATDSRGSAQRLNPESPTGDPIGASMNRVLAVS